MSGYFYHTREVALLWCCLMRGIISVQNVRFKSSVQMLGMLKQLVYLDMSKNTLEMVDEQICGCESLQDLLLSNNALTQLPGSIGKYDGI